MNRFPTGFSLTIPAWLESELAAVPDVLPDQDERIRWANRLALRNIEEGTGGPFAALVTEGPDHRVVSAGVNLVLHSGLSAAHAEVVALQLAHAATGLRDLSEDFSERTLSVNAQPCAMCLGALLWSGVRHVETAIPGNDVEALTGFDEGPVPRNWMAELERRGIGVATGLLREESLAVFGEYRRRVAQGLAVLYNAARPGEPGTAGSGAAQELSES